MTKGLGVCVGILATIMSGPAIAIEPDAFMTAMPGRVAPGTLDAFLSSAQVSVPAARAEQDGIFYALLRDLLDPDLFYSVQAWPSGKAFDHHMKAPAHVRRMEEVKDMRYTQATGDRYALVGADRIAASDLAQAPTRWIAEGVHAADKAPSGKIIILCGTEPTPGGAAQWLKDHGPAILRDPRTISYHLASDAISPSRLCVIHARRAAPRRDPGQAEAIVPPGFVADDGRLLTISAWRRVVPMNLSKELQKLR